MKKILAFALTLALFIGTAVSSIAASPITSVTDPANKDTHDVNGKYIAGASAPATYSVGVSWGSLQFTYTAGAQTWNATTHSFDAAAGVWAPEAPDADKITVENDSNAQVRVNVTYLPDATAGQTINANVLNGTDQILESAAAAPYLGDGDNSPSVVATLSPVTDLSDTSNGFIKIGTVTVAVTAVS